MWNYRKALGISSGKAEPVGERNVGERRASSVRHVAESREKKKKQISRKHRNTSVVTWFENLLFIYPKRGGSDTRVIDLMWNSLGAPRVLEFWASRTGDCLSLSAGFQN